jgi:Transposase IS66 family
MQSSTWRFRCSTVAPVRVSRLPSSSFTCVHCRCTMLRWEALRRPGQASITLSGSLLRWMPAGPPEQRSRLSGLGADSGPSSQSDCLAGRAAARRAVIRQNGTTRGRGRFTGARIEKRSFYENFQAKAMDYILKRWGALTRFLNDGRVCLSNNAAERALRGIALGRK